VFNKLINERNRIQQPKKQNWNFSNIILTKQLKKKALQEGPYKKTSDALQGFFPFVFEITSPKGI
jgi:hypothetical protein